MQEPRRRLAVVLVFMAAAVIAGCAGAPLAAASGPPRHARPWIGQSFGACSGEAQHAAVLSRGDAGAVHRAVRACLRTRSRGARTPTRAPVTGTAPDAAGARDAR